MHKINKYKRIYWLTNLVLLLLLINVGTISQAAEGNKAVFQLGSDKYIINGLEQSMDVIPFIDNGMVFVPIRYMVRACGLEDKDLVWDNSTKTVILNAKKKMLILQSGRLFIKLNNSSYFLEAKSIELGDRNYIPARIVAESLGFCVEWDEANKAVLIYSDGTIRPQPLYLERFLLVNKEHALSSGYQTDDLVSFSGQLVSSLIYNPLQKLFNEALNNGITFQLTSGFRTFDQQKALFNQRITQLGLAKTKLTVAQPGFSEHQTGLAVDIAGNQDTFNWLKANSWRYGFVLRYPKDKENVTGYTYEPWHYRYIGVPLAKFMHYKGINTIEELMPYIGE